MEKDNTDNKILKNVLKCYHDAYDAKMKCLNNKNRNNKFSEEISEEMCNLLMNSFIRICDIKHIYGYEYD